MIIESETQKLEFTPLPEQYHSADNIDKNQLIYTSKEIYLDKIMDTIQSFNAEGYCRYEGIENQQYNPFKKIEDLIYEIYDLYNKMDHTKDSQEVRMKRVITKLMRSNGATYPIQKKLVTLHQYSASDVFDEITFSKIVLFCTMSNIDSPNIIRLINDRETFALISKAINTPIRSRY